VSNSFTAVWEESPTERWDAGGGLIAASLPEVAAAAFELVDGAND